MGSKAVALLVKTPNLAGAELQLSREKCMVLSYLGANQEGMSDSDWDRLAGVVKREDLIKEDGTAGTFIHQLASNGYIKPAQMAKFVQKVGPEGLKIRNYDGDTPLDMAKLYGDEGRKYYGERQSEYFELLTPMEEEVVSLEEAKSRILALLDMGADDCVTRMELECRLSDLGCDADEVQRISLKVDANNDGVISAEELQAAMGWLRSEALLRFVV